MLKQEESVANATNMTDVKEELQYLIKEKYPDYDEEGLFQHIKQEFADNPPDQEDISSSVNNAVWFMLWVGLGIAAVGLIGLFILDNI
jgi:hypothetical protein